MLILSGIQVIRHFIEFVVVETKQFVSSNIKLILMRQTCGHYSSISAGSKRRALAFYFCVRICNMFHISECRGESDPGLCTTCVLAKGIPRYIGRQISTNFAAKHFFNRKSPPRSSILFASTQVVHRRSSGSPLQFDIRNI